MSVFLMITYDVSDPERYADYNPASLAGIMPTLAKHGGEVVMSGPPEVLAGAMEHTIVGIKFPDAEAAKAWADDEEYAPFKAIRYESTTNITEYIVAARD